MIPEYVPQHAIVRLILHQLFIVIINFGTDLQYLPTISDVVPPLMCVWGIPHERDCAIPDYV